MKDLLSSCRLSIRACFCTCVMRLVFLGGLVVGVRDGLSMLVLITGAVRCGSGGTSGMKLDGRPCNAFSRTGEQPRSVELELNVRT